VGVMEDYSALSDISVGFKKFFFLLRYFSTYVLPKGKIEGATFRFSLYHH